MKKQQSRRVLVLDGQGGGMGAQLIRLLAHRFAAGLRAALCRHQCSRHKRDAQGWGGARGDR